MNQCGDGENPFCYFHPKEKLVGVCAFCLKERLVVLASKQGHLPLSKDTRKSSSSYNVLQRKSSLAIPKIFALGSFLLRSHQNKSVDFDQDTSTSHEDSFISIKFEDNGIASWDKNGTYSKVPLEASNNQKSKKVSLNPIYISNTSSSKDTTSKTSSVIEHVKPHATSLWWRKRIGQLFQLVRWKGSSKANVCHVGTKVGGVKVKRGWMRTLAKKKKTME